MFEEIDAALKTYNDSWVKLVEARADKAFFAGLKPVSVGWKVDGDEAYAAAYQELRQACDRTVETWMNGRWIAKMHLKDQTLEGGIQIIKLMQRRPGSSDALGLDHVDFIARRSQMLKQSSRNSQTLSGRRKAMRWFRVTSGYHCGLTALRRS